MPRGSISFSLPAGHTCPFAGRCLTKVNIAGQMQLGQRYVCMAASEEISISVRQRRWFNFNLLKKTGDDTDEMYSLISASIPESQVYVLHQSGDFFSENYFKAWMSVAKQIPDSVFLVQTTSIPYWVALKSSVPSNVKISANLDTVHAPLVKKEGLPFHGVVFSYQDAEDYGLPVERRLDKLAAGENYVALVRSMQVADSEAGKGVETLRTGRCLPKETLEGSPLPVELDMR